MKAEVYLAGYAQKAEKYINEFFAKKKKETSKISPVCSQMISVYQKHLQGGKKARGALMVLGYLLAGKKPNAKIYQASIFPEIIQSFLLIHDDIMDQDLLRRGKPTPEAFYVNHYRRKHFQGNAGHFGLSMALDLGDLGMFLAQEALCQSGFEKAKIYDVLSLANQTYQKTAFGQALDVFGEASGKFDENYVLKIHLFKTAEYSVASPLKFGALLAGASSKFLQLLDQYGQSVGIAFQLQDDILGLFGDEAVLGKTIGRDIKEKKVTLLIVEALKKASQKDKKILKKLYGKQDITRAEIKKVQQLVQKTGALDYSQKRAEVLVEKGKEIIPQITQNQNYQDTLYNLADFMVQRKK